jgi:hypothetical protein
MTIAGVLLTAPDAGFAWADTAISNMHSGDFSRHQSKIELNPLARLVCITIGWCFVTSDAEKAARDAATFGAALAAVPNALRRSALVAMDTAGFECAARESTLLLAGIDGRRAVACTMEGQNFFEPLETKFRAFPSIAATAPSPGDLVDYAKAQLVEGGWHMSPGNALTVATFSPAGVRAGRVFEFAASGAPKAPQDSHRESAGQCAVEEHAA